jgi:hydroxypyruvate isomerase
MPRFAANLTMLFTELPFLDRFAAAGQAGFRFVEYLFPYAYEPAVLRQALGDNGLTQVLFNLPAGNWEAGDRGLAADPARVAEFRKGVDTAVAYALTLGVKKLNCLAGVRPKRFSESESAEILVDNLIFAADALAVHGLTLVIEAINRFDIPGFLLHRAEQVDKIIEAVDRPNVAIQFDVYHTQREQGDITATLRAHIGRIGHIQVADNPGRHQPGTGEINYPFVFAELDRLGYDGFVGLEYVPAPDTTASLAWLPAMGFSL